MKSVHRALTTEDTRCLICGRTWASTTERGFCNTRASNCRALSQCNHLLSGHPTPKAAWTEQAPSGLVFISLHFVATKRSWTSEVASPVSNTNFFSSMLNAGNADASALSMSRARVCEETCNQPQPKDAWRSVNNARRRMDAQSQCDRPRNNSILGRKRTTHGTSVLATVC